MTNRINLKFSKLKKANKKALIVYIMAGVPNINFSQKLVLALEQNGVDLVELGVPFSDPLADGPIIQQAGTRALKHAVNIAAVFSLAKRIRAKTQIPLILMLYYNLILHLGEEKFCKQAKFSGIDGLIVPDLPIEEAQSLKRTCRKNNLATIFFVTPTSSFKRVKRAIFASTGFIYYISRTGVTGKKTKLADTLKAQIRQIRRISKKPVCVGFGINSQEQVRAINRIADGCIIGSAVVAWTLKNIEQNKMIDNISKFVRSLNV
jgi:tryptophan synthase alpha chain